MLYKWAVIGAGPAGIAAVGKLLDQQIPPQEILWLDPEFKVGDFQQLWHDVSSNTRVKLFLKFFNDCRAFNYAARPQPFAIDSIDPEATCQLALAAEPLQWITEQLTKHVVTVHDYVTQLSLQNRCWNLQTAQSVYMAQQVILATGSNPDSLKLSGPTELPLAVALDPQQLAATCQATDTVAVFGASHSAIIILQTLLDHCHVKRVINFYLSPLRYAVDMGDWILHDNLGLKGNAAVWARVNIDGQLPPTLTRILSTPENIKQFLPQCDKVIYATGFNPRLIPVAGFNTLSYNNKNGIIAPGLFGLGIAYPEATVDRYGSVELNVGLWKFMDYLNRVLPVWLKYGP